MPAMPEDFPAHASPAFPPVASPKPQHRERNVSDLNLAKHHDATSHPALVSPAYTPPRTPSLERVEGQRHDRQPRSVPIKHSDNEEASKDRRLFLDELPEVRCEVRARIPTTTGMEMWLHLYSNNVDSKEHLAIVFGPRIRSRSLDEVRPGESERERMIRGAYVGTLFPGRTSSRRVEELRKEEGSVRTNGMAARNGEEQQAEMEARPLDPPLVRIHSECYTGETVWSARCDCGEQLDEAARLMSLPAPTPSSTGPPTPTSITAQHQHSINPSITDGASAGGVIIYLRQEGRGIGLLAKLQAYNLQDLGHDTLEANLLLRHPGDARSYGLATAMLLDLGLGGERGIRLLTNNPEKVRAVEGRGREVVVRERVPMIPLAWTSGGKEGVQGAEVERYIGTKIEKFKHMFSG